MDFLVKGNIVLYIAKVKIKGKKINIKANNKFKKSDENVNKGNIYIFRGGNIYIGAIKIKIVKNPEILKINVGKIKYVENPETIKTIEIILTILCFFIRSSLFIINHYSECIPLN
jgi:hypothetical protein